MRSTMWEHQQQRKTILGIRRLLIVISMGRQLERQKHLQTTLEIPLQPIEISMAKRLGHPRPRPTTLGILRPHITTNMAMWWVGIIRLPIISVTPIRLILTTKATIEVRLIAVQITLAILQRIIKISLARLLELPSLQLTTLGIPTLNNIVTIAILQSGRGSCSLPFLSYNDIQKRVRLRRNGKEQGVCGALRP